MSSSISLESKDKSRFASQINPNLPESLPTLTLQADAHYENNLTKSVSVQKKA